jgi:hypothetical protein
MDGFGHAIAIDGDTAVVGAEGTTGAYVFARVNGTWSFEQKLTVSNGGLSIGFAVAISHETLVISSHYENQTTGAVYVFVHRNGSWVLQQRLSPSDGVPGSYFGVSVAIGRDTLLVEAPAYTPPFGSATPATYVFERHNGVWSQTQKLVAGSVALDRDTAVIGAPEDDSNRGAAYVFERHHDRWLLQQKLPGSSSGAYFGGSVALSDRVILAGAPGTRWTPNSGPAPETFFYGLEHGIWSPTQVEPSIYGPVAISRDYAVIADVNTVTLWKKNAGVWLVRRELSAANTGSTFGSSVALSGNTALVSAPTPTVSGPSPGTGADGGIVYVFEEACERQ